MKHLASGLAAITPYAIVGLLLYSVGHLQGYQRRQDSLRQWALDQGLAHTQKNQAGDVLYVWRGLSAPVDPRWSTSGPLKVPVVLRVSDK